MALSTKDIYSLIKEFNEYGATIYYLVKQGKIKLDDVTNLLFKDDIEQIDLLFPKFICNIGLEDIKESDEQLRKEFTKLDCIDRIIEKDNNKHLHLKEIRNIVNLDEIIDDMIKNKTYNMAYNLHYTEKILNMIDSSKKKSYLSIREKLKLYQTALSLLIDDSDKKISSNIDSYYITTITK